MARVLVIEDETVLRASVARGIAKLGAEVTEAATLNDALRAVDQIPPDLVISDIDLPERSGIELVGELGRRGLKIPIVFVSGYLHAYRAQIPHHASIEVLEKPVPIDELRAVVARRLGESSAAEVAPFSVPDYLQLACMGRHSVSIEVEREGRVVGEVIVCKGDIWSARDSYGSGLEALGRLAFEESALVRCRRLNAEVHVRELQGAWEFLLMEAARVADESRRSGDVPAASAVQPRMPEADSTQQRFEALWEEGLDAMLSRDYPRALQVFTDANKLMAGDPKVLANIARLNQLGYQLPLCAAAEENADAAASAEQRSQEGAA